MEQEVNGKYNHMTLQLMVMPLLNELFSEYMNMGVI